MKNILAENMLRFGVKNLSKSDTKIVKMLAEAPTDKVPSIKNYGGLSDIQTNGGTIQNMIGITGVGKGNSPVGYVAENLTFVPNIFQTKKTLVLWSKLYLNRGEKVKQGGAETNANIDTQGAYGHNDKTFIPGTQVGTGGSIVLISDQNLAEVSDSMNLSWWSAGTAKFGVSSAYLALQLTMDHGTQFMSEGGGNKNFPAELDRIMSIIKSCPGAITKPWDQTAAADLSALFKTQKQSVQLSPVFAKTGWDSYKIKG